MLEIIFLVLMVCLFVYLLLFVYVVAMVGGRISLSVILTLLIPLAIIIYLSMDLKQDYSLTHPNSPRVNFMEVKKGEKLLVDDKIVEFEKYTDGKVVVNYNGELKVYKEKFNKFERISD